MDTHAVTRKLLFLTVLLSGTVLAEGPVFKSSDTYTQQEFDNVYSDLRKVSAAQGLTTNTSGQVLVGQGNGNNPIFQSAAQTLTTGRILQIVSFQTTTASSTISAIFVPTNVTATITPLLSGSTIFILANGTLQNNNINATSAVLTLDRGTTNLGSSTLGLQRLDGATTNVQVDSPCPVIWFDSPNTLSATTYTIYMKSTSGANTIGFPASGSIANMWLVEIGS